MDKIIIIDALLEKVRCFYCRKRVAGVAQLRDHQLSSCSERRPRVLMFDLDVDLIAHDGKEVK